MLKFPDESRYIGVTLAGFDNRTRNHWSAARSGKSQPVCAAIRKFGSFEMVPLVVSNDMEYLLTLEKKAIIAFDTLYPQGLNLSEKGTKAPTNYSKECGYCDKEFRAHKNRQYCSDVCRRRASLDRNASWEDCEVCGTFFKAKYGDKRFCSVECGNTGKNRPKRAVWVDGIRYDTLTQAAKAHGVSVGCVPNRALSANWTNWSF